MDTRVPLLLICVGVAALVLMVVCMLKLRRAGYMKDYDQRRARDAARPNGIESASMARLPPKVFPKRPVYKRRRPVAPGISVRHGRWMPNRRAGQTERQAVLGESLTCVGEQVPGFSTVQVDGDGLVINEIAVAVHERPGGGGLEYQKGGIARWANCKPSKFPGQYATDENMQELGKSLGMAAAHERAGHPEAARAALAIAANAYNERHGQRFLGALQSASQHAPPPPSAGAGGDVKDGDSDSSDDSWVAREEATIRRQSIAGVMPLTTAQVEALRRIDSRHQDWMTADDNEEYQDRMARQVTRNASWMLKQKPGARVQPAPASTGRTPRRVSRIMSRVKQALSPASATSPYSAITDVDTEALEEERGGGGGVGPVTPSAARDSDTDSDGGAEDSLQADTALQDAPLDVAPGIGLAFNVVYKGAARRQLGHPVFRTNVVCLWHPDTEGKLIRFKTTMALWSIDLDTALLLGMLVYACGGDPVHGVPGKLLRRWGTAHVSADAKGRVYPNRPPFVAFAVNAEGTRADPVPLFNPHLRFDDRIDVRQDFLAPFRNMTRLAQPPIRMPAYQIVSALHTGAAIMHATQLRNVLSHCASYTPGMHHTFTLERLHPVERAAVEGKVFALAEAPEIRRILEHGKMLAIPPMPNRATETPVTKLFDHAIPPGAWKANPVLATRNAETVASPSRTQYSSTTATTESTAASRRSVRIPGKAKSSPATRRASRALPPGAVIAEDISDEERGHSGSGGWRAAVHSAARRTKQK